jgi:hypothetical protein
MLLRAIRNLSGSELSMTDVNQAVERSVINIEEPNGHT